MLSSSVVIGVRPNPILAGDPRNNVLVVKDSSKLPELGDIRLHDYVVAHGLEAQRRQGA